MYYTSLLSLFLHTHTQTQTRLKSKLPNLVSPNKIELGVSTDDQLPWAVVLLIFTLGIQVENTVDVVTCPGDRFDP